MKRCAFAIIFVLFVPLVALSSFAQSTHIPLSNFEIVSFRGEWQYDTLYVIGEIKNVGDIPAGPKVEAIARDSKGVLIEGKKFWPNSTDNIFPGRSCGIKYPITENQQAKTVEIKVISVDTW